MYAARGLFQYKFATGMGEQDLTSFGHVVQEATNDGLQTLYGELSEPIPM